MSIIYLTSSQPASRFLHFPSPSSRTFQLFSLHRRHHEHSCCCCNIVNLQPLLPPPLLSTRGHSNIPPLSSRRGVSSPKPHYRYFPTPGLANSLGPVPASRTLTCKPCSSARSFARKCHPTYPSSSQKQNRFKAIPARNHSRPPGPSYFIKT